MQLEYQLTRYCQEHLNDRIKKIKHKYAGSSLNSTKSRQYMGSNLNSSLQEGLLAMSMIEADCTSLDKENQMIGINGVHNKINDFKPRKLKDTQRIQQLTEINDKIGKLIECLKIDQQQTQEDIQKSVCSTDVPLYTSSTDLRRSMPNVKANKQSIGKNYGSVYIELPSSHERYHSVPSKSVESQRSKMAGSIVKRDKQTGKLSRTKNITKSTGLLSSHQHLDLVCEDEQEQKYLIREFCRQISLDNEFMKHKTKLIRRGRNVKQLLESAAAVASLSQDEKELLLEWNFEDIDPLYTERAGRCTQQEDTHNLVFVTIDSFLKCQQNWAKKVHRKFNGKKLRFEELDREDKGYFLKQDLCGFISRQSKQMYCNRDINLIFRRVNKKRGRLVTIKDLLNSLSY